ncbi:MAG: DUF4175 domain-containing protein [Chloroflexales bacterium]|nr:DUF4175 domain-containing protein [Chloroflexales bacterium]
MRNSLQIQLDRLASDRWARRGVRLLLRVSVLALSLVCVAVGLHLLLGWPLRWTWIASAALGCIAVGAVLVLRPRMPAVEVARRLDRRFALGEQLTTALEVGPQAEGVGIYLHEQSRRTLAQIRRQVSARQRFPWPDLALVLALLLLLAGLLVLTGIGSALPPLTAEPLPPLAGATDPARRFPEESFQPPSGSQPGPGQGQTLVPGSADAAAVAALADALRDQSVTRPAAEALDQGDLGGAAQGLRELADQARGLSDQARAELAQSLREAADQIAQTNPGLADQVRASAEGIGPAGDAPAQALEDLADAVEQLGQGQQPGQGQGQQPGQGQGQGQDQGQAQGAGGAGQSSLPGQQREGSSERLGVDGVPLELEGNGPGDTPAPGDPKGPPAQGGGTGAGGGFSRGSQSGERVEVGDDPLRIPADLRDVVQNYFSP